LFLGHRAVLTRLTETDNLSSEFFLKKLGLMPSQRFPATVRRRSAMSQNPADVTNPGSVNVANEGFGKGPINPNQPVGKGPGTNPGPVVQGLADAPGRGVPASQQTVQKSPSSNSGPLVHADAEAPGLGPDSPNQPVTVGPSQNSGPLVQGGTASPTSSNIENTTQNNVAGQVYGTGTPKNVFV
jgi:hypothetical protein